MLRYLNVIFKMPECSTLILIIVIKYNLKTSCIVLKNRMNRKMVNFDGMFQLKFKLNSIIH